MKNATTRHAHSEQTLHTEIWSTKDIILLQKSMIIQAIEDLKDGRKSEKMQREAKEWICSNDTKNPFSFINCCDGNNLNGCYLRWLIEQTLRGGIYDTL
ncbi:hypothetical protein VHA01S_080_00060 [Vibrio halioticoli NBRC 102217]|uniref:Uncharacterized protein n=1 Tax=Vibrio halioticoli NBRC 102217 TaxID=1219072 RepID=V5FNV7_9VIBR|nr:hypothetical protein [Vibrio halioticoli]GAD91266.1 hypothetical protein VHA01S_080_00060 [Vibrio halioticoli NBRC 102217]